MGGRLRGLLFRAVIFLWLAFLGLAKDYYSILGVDKSADEAALKQSYRKLARRWHPDKNPNQKDEAEERFREIQSAYDVLSDPEKRKIYDRYGEEGVKQHEAGAQPGAGPEGFGSAGFDPEDIFGGGFGQGSRTFTFEFRGPGGGGAGFDPFSMFNEFFNMGGSAGGPEGGARFGGPKGGQYRHEQQRGGPRSQEDLYGQDSLVNKLGQGRFPGHNARHIWLVEFYVPWCGHCRRLAPVMEKTASLVQGLAKVGGVNCETEQALCKSQGVEAYPTIRLVVAGSSIPYEGPKTSEGLHDFVSENLPEKAMHHLRRPESLDEFVKGPCSSSSWGACAAVLTTEFAPWPATKAAAFNLRGRMPLAESRGANPAITSRLDARRLPAVVVICGGDVQRREVHDAPGSPRELLELLYRYKEGEGCKGVQRKEGDIPPLEKGRDYSKLRVKQLRELLQHHGVECQGCVEKADYVRQVERLVADQGE